MIGIEEPQEIAMEVRRRELAGLLAKGFLRFRKRVDYNDIIRRCATESTSVASQILADLVVFLLKRCYSDSAYDAVKGTFIFLRRGCPRSPGERWDDIECTLERPLSK